ncbi:unnamed protein product [Phytomonas sp. Hart1]|nr:unnamed protein product [Phytomonas sp. Hart1]|eukprot:CCW68865.1 unnamed protein product [Phytomonas sp. isolate Hart1]
MGMEAADLSLIAADNQASPIVPAAYSDGGTQQSIGIDKVNRIGAHKHRHAQAAAKASQISLAGRESGSILVFAEHSDRLLCDPTNSLRAYGVYQFKYVSTPAESEAEVQELLDRLMRTAMSAYERSVEVYMNLSNDMKTALMLRHVPMMVSQVVALPSLLSKLKISVMQKKANTVERASIYSSRRKSGTAFFNPPRPMFLPSTTNCRKKVPMPQQQQLSPKNGGRKLSYVHVARDLKGIGNISSSSRPIGNAPTLSFCSVSHSDEALEYKKTRQCPSKTFEDDVIAVSAAAMNTAQSLTALEHPQPTGHSDAKDTFHSNRLEEVVQTLAQLWPHYSDDEQANLMQSRPYQKQQRSSSRGVYESARMNGNGVDQCNSQMGEETLEGDSFLSSMSLKSRPTIHVLIDIIASRKALGANPSQSRPHQLAQLIYTGLQRYSKAACLHACIGISDTNIKLVCRDVLFPLQVSPSVVSSGTSFRGHTARTPLRRSGSMIYSEGLNSVNQTRLAEPGKRTGKLSRFNIHKGDTTGFHDDTNATTFSSGLLPCTRLPPVGVELIDQAHLFICMPSNFL